MSASYNDPLKPLEKRPYRFKDSTLNFYCPLCRSERSFTIRPRLTIRHYFQILLTTMILMFMFYPWMQMKSAVFLFIVWAAFEFSVRFLFKKEVPCPYCGFDATWYKRDVKVAKQKVQEFWNQKPPAPPENRPNL